MRGKLGLVLIFLGGLLLGVGLLAQVYAVPRLELAPLDTNVVTDLEGEATLGGPDGPDTFPVRVFSTTRADTEVSDDEVVAYQRASCVVRDVGTVEGCVSNADPQERLLTASTDEFATDRATGEAVNDAEYLSASAVPHEGLVNKFPFNAEEKDYPYWSGTLGEAVTAAYQRSTEIDGLPVHVYQVSIQDAPIEITEDTPGLYNETTDIVVEPTTGSIVYQEGSTERLTEDGELFLSLDVAFTDEQTDESVAEAGDLKDQLGLITTTIPLVGYIGGGVLLVVGIVLLLLQGRSRRSGQSGASVEKPREPAGSRA